MKDERKFKIGEEVMIFTHLILGQPNIEKGCIVGVRKVTNTLSVWNYQYCIWTGSAYYDRFPDAIYKSVEEMGEALKDLVAE